MRRTPTTGLDLLSASGIRVGDRLSRIQRALICYRGIGFAANLHQTPAGIVRSLQL